MKKNYILSPRLAERICSSAPATRTFVLTCILLAGAFLNVAHAQLTGTKNIPGDYATLAAAISDLNTQGVGAGGVTLNLLAGNPQTAPAGGYVIGDAGSAILSGANATGATKQVTITGNGNTITASAALTAGNLNDGIFKLIGADWIRIQGFTMVENAANTVNTPAASNNMTEWGVALLYVSATDGAQNNTIQNNTITLSRTYANSFGVYSNVRHTAADVTTLADITDAVTGPNHSNKVYGNAINNVNFGIVFVGSATAANMDNANDIGGAAAGTGNNVTNYGGLGSLSTYNGFPTTIVSGAYLVNQNNHNLSFNSFISASLNTAVALRGILTDYSVVPTGTITNNVNNNTVTFTQAGTGGFQCITTSAVGTAANVTQNLNSNLIINNAITGVSSAVAFLGVVNLGAFGTLNMNNNIFHANTTTATTAGFTAVGNQGAIVNTLNMNGNQVGDAVAGAITFTAATTAQINPIINFSTGGVATTTVNINNNVIRGISVVSTGQVTAVSNQSTAVGVAINIKDNQIGTATADCYTYSAASSGGFVPVFNAGGAATALLTITGNDIRRINNIVTGSGVHTYIGNQTFTGSTIISNNTFTNITANTTGSVTFINNNVTRAANTTVNVNNNTVVTGYNKPGAGGTVLFYNSFSTSGTTVTETNTGNNFSNMTFTGATTITGWRCSDGLTNTGPPKTVTNNTFNNITGGTSSITILQSSFGVSATVSGNTVTNISGAAAIIGYATLGGSSTITQNTITGLSSTVGLVTGMSIAGGTGSVISALKNKIGNLVSTNATGTVNGIAVSGGITTTLANNLIGDLRAPITSSTADAIRGINITTTTASSAVNVYYNTVNINAQSTGANFSTSGIFHTTSATATTAALDLRNNVIVNNSTANGTGLTVAYRRSSTTLTNYASSSNNNLFWAGGVGACTSRFVYHDGTAGLQLAPFQTLVTPRETASVTEDPQFLSTTATAATFLHVNPAVATQIESAAATIASVTDDYEGDVRSATPDMGADEFAGILDVVCNGTPVAGTASPASSTICTGQSVNICLSGQTPPTGTTIQWRSATVSGGPYTDIPCALSNCYNTGVLAPGTYYYVAVITCSTSGSTATSNQVTVVVNPNPTAAVMPATANVCLGSSQVLTASGGATYTWSPATGLSATTGAVVTATPTVTTTYVVTVSDAIGCSATASTTLTVLSVPTGVTASATPAAICSGGSSQLNSTVATGLPLDAYTLTALTGQTYAPLTGGGITIINTAAQLTPGFATGDQDDGGVLITLPFTFSYMGNSFTQMSMCTNGWVAAGNLSTIDGPNSRAPGNFFTTTIPNNTIAPWFKDMGANFPLGTGSMRHGLTGTGIYSFQWDNAIGSGFTDGSTILISFQVNIHGPASATPGRVELVYGPTTGTITFAAAIGVEDAIGGATHFINALNGSNTSTTTSTVWPGNGNGYRFSPVVPGYSWSPTTFLNNPAIANPLASNVTNTTTYTVTVTGGNGCSSTASTTVTVNLVPQFTVTGGGSYCAGGVGVPVGLSGSQTGTNYQLQLNGVNDGAPVAGTGAAISFGNHTTAGTYTVIGTNTTTTCTGSMSNSVVISINPVPVLSNTVVQPTTCVSADGSINLTVSGAAPGPYTYNWSTPNGSGLVNGQEDQTNLTVGNYLVTVTSTNGCSSTAVITLSGPGGCSVCPLFGAFTANPVGQTCAGSSFTLTQTGLTDMGLTYGITFKSFAAPTADPYTGGTVLATVANGSLTGGGTTATASVSIATAGTYYLYAILSPTPLDVSCRPSATLTYVINPIPTAIATPTTQTICSGGAITTIVWSGPVPNTTYNWVRNNTANVTGIAASGAGNISGSLTNTTTTQQTTVFTVTPVANGCSGNSSTTATVIVNPTPNAVATPASQTICSGATITTIALTGNVANTTYNWTRNNTATVTGIAATGSGNIAGALVNTTNAPVTVTFVITPTANNCPGTAINATVLVNPTPTAFTVTGGGTICNTDNVGAVVGLSGSQTSVNYQLRVNNTNTGAPVAGTGNAISFGPQTVAGTYTVVATSTQGGCTASMTGTVTVATIVCGVSISDPCVCLNNATSLINGQFGETIKVNAPGNQTWTVTAVTGLYQPGGAGPPAAPILIPVGTALTNLGPAMNMFQLVGKHVDAIGYTITVSNGQGTSLSIGNSCAYPNPAITSDLSDAFCLNSNPVTLTGDPGDANIVSQGFTVNGAPATQFDPGQGVGQYVIVYTVNGGTPKASGPTDPGCIQSVSQTVHVLATPSVLNCNDQVYISLPGTCVGEIQPDDVLEGTYGCYDDYIVELDKTLPLGNGPWQSGVLGASDIGRTYQVRVTHQISGNKCWGLVTIEDKVAPSLTCENFSIPCNTPNLTPNYLVNVLGITVANPTVTDCQNYTLTYIDSEVQQDCASGFTKVISRKWTATDASGNSSTCIQLISLIRPTLGDVVTPPDYDGIDAQMFNCTDNAFPTPQWIEAQGLQGFPYVFGQTAACNIDFAYEDIVIKVCDGTYKIRRQWTVLDWCVGDGFVYNQIIKVVDNEGPAFVCPANTTVSIDPFSCCAFVNLPDAIVEDNCSRINNVSGMVVTFDQYTGEQSGMFTFGGTVSNFPGNNLWDLDTLGAFGWTPCLPIGTQTVTYIAEDDCGNTTSCTFRLTVRDYIPPIAVCDETTTVGIGVDDPFDCYGPAGPLNVPVALTGCENGGVTWVKAKDLGDGSYDYCGNVKYSVRRMAPYSDCIQALNATNGTLPCDDQFQDFPSEFERAITEGDSIKFYCCEVGTTQTVVLRVYQIDLNGNFTIGPDGEPVYNECMIQVEVQDKLKPYCQPPAHVTVACEQFDPSLWLYGKAQVLDNCCLDQTKVYQEQCGLTHSASYTQFDTVCNKGTIIRTFRAFDCHGQTSQCTQRVVVNYNQDYFVKFPNDVIVTVCDGTGNYGEPIYFGEDCELLGATYQDAIFTVVPDACFKIERTWKIINWCTYNSNLPCINVPNPNPAAISNAPANLPGPTVSRCGTLAPWAPTVVKINPTDAVATNFCTFWDANANCYIYKQIIKIIDGIAPVVVGGCPASPDTICDITPNNNQLWNDMPWWDNTNQSHDLCEAPADICITATDACSGSNINIEYQLFLDLDGDGVMETIINSINTGIAGLGWNAVPFGNANGGAGTIRTFDQRPVNFNQKYGFAIQETVSGNNKTACVRFNTQQAQNTFVPAELPYGTHKIKWFISDGCGNESVCEYTIIIRDCKAPTVVCYHGLSVNIMPGGMIGMWDTDFLQYTEDNCTQAPYLKTAIRKCGQGTGFPVDANGQPVKSVTFTCDELGEQCVEIWSIDLAGNADYCQTYIDVQDNNSNCGPNSGTITISGALKTEAQEGVGEAVVEMSVQSSTGNYILNNQSTNGGGYSFNNVPTGSNVVVTPTKDDNPLNGVTTYDLVLISKHILGIEPLGSPYKMIAADANKSNSLTTFDIVELRKLILGIYQELPNNTSWRFVEKAQVFANPQNPFMGPISENVSLTATQSLTNQDFVGVKIGDVNGSAVANTLMTSEDRTAGTLLFDVNDRSVKAGEVFEVVFNAAGKTQGYQMTLNLKGLEVSEIVSSDNVTANNFGVFADALTVSVDGSDAFAVKFRATKSGKLSEMMTVSSRITKAEAYLASAEGKADVALRFDGKTIAGVGFELYQNEPNPFVNKTFIGFHLPEATTATLTVYDETGRLIFTQKGEFAKGYNSITLDRAVINTTGVLYYSLETATDAATKKMIQSK